jgi:hypothetical protein
MSDDPRDPANCGWRWPEELQRDPDSPPSRWPFWIGLAIVAGVIAGVWSL